MSVENKYRTAALAQWNGTLPYTYEGLQLAALMAILDELKRLNAVMQCPNTARIPRYLARIATNTAKPKKKRARKESGAKNG